MRLRKNSVTGESDTLSESRDSLERLNTAQAAARLGITEAGVRKRVQRGQIPYERDETGRLWIWVSPDETRHAEARDRDRKSRHGRVEELLERVGELHDQIHYLRALLNEEQDARRRADMVIAQLSAANAEQARTIRAIEAPSREEMTVPPVAEPPSEQPRESPTAATDIPMGGGSPSEASEEAQEPTENSGGPGSGTERNSWWRRLFGA